MHIAFAKGSIAESKKEKREEIGQHAQASILSTTGVLRSVELELLLAEAEGEGQAEGEDAAGKIVRAPPTGAAIFGPGTPKTVNSLDTQQVFRPFSEIWSN